jgi:outer membrane cobalamin receptor
MKTINLLALLVSLIAVMPASAQSKFTLSGTVRDGKTGETLIGVTIQVAQSPAVGTVTNEYGFFSLTLPGDNYALLISSVGYRAQTRKVALNASQTINIALMPEGSALDEVVVFSTAKNAHVASAQMGMEKLSIKEISAIPMLFGEKDLMKVIQLLPGVKAAGEGNTGFYVRGGAADQNLVLLDNATVYNPSHLLGFFSTFNSDAIKDVAIFKGGMPAQYGGRLSSVLDIKMNDGNDQQIHGSGGLGLISSRLNVEGPITKDKGSFLVSARRTYADVYLKLSSDSTKNRNNLYFYDLNAKASYKLGDKDRIFLSGYFGKDVMAVKGLFGLDWKNATGTIRWNHLITDKDFSNTSLVFSDYNYNINVTLNTLDARIHSEIRDWNLKQEFEFYSNPTNTIRVGLSAINHTITPGTFALTAFETKAPGNRALENALYLSNSWKPNAKWNVDYGIRLSAFTVMGGSNFYQLNEEHNIVDTLKYGTGEIVKTYINPEPRISASYMLNKVSSIKGSYARNAQYMHLISNSTSGNPTDKWVGSNNIIKPGIADQVAIGYYRNFRNDAFEFSAETYYKWMQNQIDYKDGANVLSNDPIEPQLLFGDGRAYGLELLLRKKTGKLTGWVGYTLSRTEQQINGINNSEWYVARQDRTHDMSIVGIYQPNAKWTFSGTWIYGTGNAVSFPGSKYVLDGQVRFNYTERNGYRMPANHRLDLGVTRQLKHHAHYSSEINFSLYNAYGRENAYIITFREDANDKTKTVAEQFSLFRVVPSLSYNFKF